MFAMPRSPGDGVQQWLPPLSAPPVLLVVRHSTAPELGAVAWHGPELAYLRLPLSHQPAVAAPYVKRQKRGVTPSVPLTKAMRPPPLSQIPLSRMQHSH
ncbi:unnamed protein product [Pleuronectes platessa]|uniref:Uncharacterized protein n=1 Tax=Pleuronectes platessa TaxID=8262 RepID=A0A9N7V3S6_PLEPL|nr:unnamed protein product [Pleuronectes platessa]